MRLGWAFLGLALAIRVGMLVNHGIDPDESQHLHAAWLVSQGVVPYRDFWEHHPPIFYWLMAPALRWLPEGPAVYLATRGLMTAVTVVTVGLTALLARRLGPGVAWPSVLALVALPQFVETTTEVRPDVPAAAAWLVAVLAVAAWRTRGRAGYLWLAGAAQGVAIGLTLKALFGLAGLAGAVVAASPAAYGTGRSTGLRLRALGGLLAGVAVPLVGMVAVLGLQGGPEAVRAFGAGLATNFRFADFGRHWPVAEEGLGFAALALGGLAWVVRRDGWRGLLAHPTHGALLSALVLPAVILFLPSTPAVYRQAWLPLYPLLALHAGVALAKLGAAAAHGGLGPRGALAVAVAAGLLAPAAVSVRTALAERNVETFRVMRLQLALSCAGEPVLDGTALYVSRPAAYRYGALIKGVRDWIAQGAIAEEEVAADLHRSAARIGYADRRLRALVGPVEDLLRVHYVATEDGLLRAGVALAVEGGPAGGRGYADLLVSGLHRLEADAGLAVAIDGQPARRGWLELAAGRHEVTWTGPAGRIRLLAASCAERAEARRLTRRGAPT